MPIMPVMPIIPVMPVMPVMLSLSKHLYRRSNLIDSTKR